MAESIYQKKQDMHAREVRPRGAVLQDNRGANVLSGETVQLTGEHTKNARPSNAEKHQKGKKAKVNANKNKLFQDAKKKGDKRSKSAILKGYGKHK